MSRDWVSPVCSIYIFLSFYQIHIYFLLSLSSSTEPNLLISIKFSYFFYWKYFFLFWKYYCCQMYSHCNSHCQSHCTTACTYEYFVMSFPTFKYLKSSLIDLVSLATFIKINKKHCSSFYFWHLSSFHCSRSTEYCPWKTLLL